jgi:hypothetical protein
MTRQPIRRDACWTPEEDDLLREMARSGHSLRRSDGNDRRAHRERRSRKPWAFPGPEDMNAWPVPSQRVQLIVRSAANFIECPFAREQKSSLTSVRHACTVIPKASSLAFVRSSQGGLSGSLKNTMICRHRAHWKVRRCSLIGFSHTGIGVSWGLEMSGSADGSTELRSIGRTALLYGAKRERGCTCP